jgi:hypothetical protein
MNEPLSIVLGGEGRQDLLNRVDPRVEVSEPLFHLMKLHGADFLDD